jgi:hypothetical protein
MGGHERDLNKKKDELSKVHSERKTEVRLDFFHIEKNLIGSCSLSRK